MTLSGFLVEAVLQRCEVIAPWLQSKPEAVPGPILSVLLQGLPLALGEPARRSLK